MLKHLNTDEMVSLTTPWETHPEARAVFLSIPEIAPLHAKIVASNTELLAIRRPIREAAAALLVVGSKATRVDVTHDALCRAVFHGLEAEHSHCLAASPPQARRAERIMELLTELFPNGLTIVNASYLAEAGNAERLDALLADQPKSVALLGSIPVSGGGNLLELTQRLIASGRELGQLEHERNVLTAKDVTRPEPSSSLFAARSRWIRVVSLVLANLELSDAPSEAIETIRGPVERASERAGLRYASRSETPEGVDDDEAFDEGLVANQGEGEGEGEGEDADADADGLAPAGPRAVAS